MGFTAWEDVFTRASPALVVIALLEAVMVLDTHWPVWVNLLVVAAGLAVVSGGLALLSRRRTGRWSLLPARVGRSEAAFFVLVPGAIQVAAGGQWALGLTTLAVNLVLLGLTYVLVAFGVLSTALATVTRAAGELAAALGRLVRVLPFLLVFSVVLFLSTEMWQVFANISGRALVVLMALFALLTGVLVGLRVARTVDELDRAIRTGADGRPAVDGPPPEQAERGNLGILVWVSQMTHVIGVSGGMGAFFCAFGMLTVGPGVRREWVGGATAWVRHLSVLGMDLEFSNVHLRVALAIACLTGVYYAVTVMSDGAYRREFLEGTAEELAPVFAERRAYHRAVDGQGRKADVGPGAG